MTHISAGDQGDAFAEVGCRFCDDFAEVTRLVRPREFKPSTTIGPRQFASATNQRGTVAPWSSEDPTIDPVRTPRRPDTLAISLARAMSAGMLTPLSENRRPRAIRSGTLRSKYRTTPTHAANWGKLRSARRAASTRPGRPPSVWPRLVATSFARRPPIPGTRIGAWGNNALQSTRPRTVRVLISNAPKSVSR